MQELIETGVIESTTLIWRVGLSDWIQAKNDPALLPFFGNAPSPMAVPPPLPSQPAVFTPGAPAQQVPPPIHPTGMDVSVTTITSYTLLSDKSRTLAGCLNLFPGLGRFYLGYPAIGALQLFLAFCGFGILWSWIDGAAILLGSCPTDGYGRKLTQ